MRRTVMLGMLSVVVLLLMTNPVIGQGGDGEMPAAPPPDANLPLQELVLDTNFRDGDWPSEQSETSSINYVATDRGYEIRSVSIDAGVGSTPFINLNIDNFYTEIELTINACADDTSALLFFSRAQPSRNLNNAIDSYVFVNQCSGDYRSRGIVDDEIVDPTVSGVTSTLEENQTYRIGYLMSDNNVAWYINGQLIEQYEVAATDIRSSGSLALGAQVGLEYTATRWRIWSLKNTGESIEALPEVVETSATDDPIADQDFGAPIYSPSMTIPTEIPLGLNHPVAGYSVGANGQIGLYNTEQPAGILRFEDLEGDNYLLATLFVVRSCEDTSSVGFVWHADAAFENYYALELDCAGDYRVFPVLDGGAGPVIVSGSLSIDLTSLQPALLRVYVRDGQTWLYLGDEVIDSFTDDTFSVGGAGLRLASSVDGIAMDILLLDLVVFDVP